jgi:hypothetical protein
MPVQMIELEEVQMVETSDESLEALDAYAWTYNTSGCVTCM